MDLAGLFPDGDYRFQLTLRREAPERFFAKWDASGALLAERKRWLETDPAKYAMLRPDGEALMEEFVALATPWESRGALAAGRPASALTVGAAFEPDLLFLSADGSGEFRLQGGALCFPTGWALSEKIGHTLDFVHRVVPGLNPALAAPISLFLTRLKPGVAFLRDNWGIAAKDDLNLHPSRQVPPPALPVRMDRLWLRVEHQALMALSSTKGVVFGIRISLHRLDGLAGTKAGERLSRALVSMPSELACYKRIESVRQEISKLLI